MNKFAHTRMTDIKKTARIAGLLYFLLIPLGVFGIKYVPSLVAPGDISETAKNIANHMTLVRLSIISALLAQLVNIAVALYLYKILSPVNKNIAKLMVLFALLAVPIAMLNELNSAAVVVLLDNVAQPLGQIDLFLNLHEYGVRIAGIFFGLWLLPMGYLVYKSQFLPRLIGVLLIIACFGYLADSFMYFLNPNFDFQFSKFTFIGEAVMTFWLLIKGVDAQKWHKQGRKSPISS